MRILIIEDEYELADILATKLEKEKYECDICTDGEDGLYNALTNAYDLILLDIMLPSMNGTEILKEIRNKGIESKVIMLTAKSSLDDKLLGFDLGANDYVTKPFHIEEVLARVNVLLRNNKKKDYIEYKDLQLNLRNSTLSYKDESIALSKKEFMIAEYFINNPGIIISKEQLYDKVWGIDNDFESNNLEAYLSFVRKKIKIIGSKVTIKSNRGLGYIMEEENE